MDTNPDVEKLLEAYRSGDQEAFDRLLPMVYDELRRIARRHLRRNQRFQTLDTTALVHEAYLKMAGHDGMALQDRAHLLAVSAIAMRQVVISHARSHQAAKRGGGEKPVTFDEHHLAIEEQAEQILDLNDALERLREKNERLARVVECRFFAGLSAEETAEGLGLTLRTAQRDWTRARAWLKEDLESNRKGKPRDAT